MASELGRSLRLAVCTILIGAVAYPLTVQAIAQAVAPEQAAGSLLRREDGSVIGSRLLAQPFRSPRYLWPRPSAVDYNAAAAVGSNLSPAGDKLRAAAAERAGALRLGAGRAVPAELLTASGSGLDPDLTLEGALAQVERIAAARQRPAAAVAALVRHRSRRIPGEARRLVNVLEANLALDALP
ncbi:MAG: potassium-transporting ATPase subunit C [Fimbriimonadaceae bacterium]|nr:potassium-transporting ATPase subunit C [Fimbriimonadaceae bacterium]